VKPRARGLIALAAAGLLVGPVGSSVARRLPAPGGSVTLALPGDLADRVLAAHSRVPLVEPVEPGEAATTRLARGQLGDEPWRSHLLTEVRASDDSSRWELVPAGGTSSVEAAVRDCFGTRAWPGRALAAAAITPTVSAGRSGLTVRFDRPVGPLLTLLSGCLAELPAAFAAQDQTLVSRGDGLGGPGLLDEIVLTDPPAVADISLGDPVRPAGTALSTRAPDVVMLVQDERARRSDLLGLGEGVQRLRELFAPDVLLAVFWGGRGSPARGLLPGGLAPSRPLPSSEPGAVPTLALDPLPSDAPRVELLFDDDDPLVVGTVERIALLLRNRGYAVGPGGPTIEVLRWRPESLDPAVALLSLAGSVGDLADPSLADEALLDPDADRRLEAALTVERRWMDEGRVVPLMFADRWISVDPDLRGVRLRPDGVPLLHDAWWGAPR